MKIVKPENDNYAALVITVKSITELEGCDNVVGTPLIGYQAIVSKETKVGDIGIVFPAETQLSDEFCKYNNLYRHPEKNKDSTQKGYFEDNRRIKAMKFRGHKSNCLFMPLSSLKFTKAKIAELKEGDLFDHLNGVKVCNKYLPKIPRAQKTIEKNKNKFVRVDTKFLPEHFDSDNYWRNCHVVPADTEVIVTQKLHGTSLRVGNTIVKRKLKLKERLAQKLGVRVVEDEYDYVFGSRKVIKDVNNPNQNHYYGTDQYSEHGKKLEGLLPKGFVVYAELIGWTTDGLQIQKNYTYKIPEKTAEIYIYRVAYINPEGRLVDLSWKQLKEFCKDLGLKHVPELWVGAHKDFNVDDFIDKRFKDEGYLNVLPLENDKTLVDEGVCVRVDGLVPYILKAKSPIFFEHESKMLDENIVDMETQESQV